MLKTLEKYNKKEAQRVLAHVADLYLPNPGIRGSDPGETDETSSRVIAELRGRIGLPGEDNSPEAQSQILSAVADEISESVLSGVSINGVKERLARQGDLPPYLYDVKFSKGYNSFREFGIEDEEVFSAIRSHDRYQHFVPPTVKSNLKSISLYLKYEESYVLLVVTAMGQRYQEVDQCWRIFRDDVALPNLAEPKEVLEAFLDKFGVSFTFGESGPSKLIISAQIYDANPRLRFKKPVTHEYQAFFVSSKRVNKASIVMLYYVVDVSSYTGSLQRHGYAQNWTPIKKPVEISLSEINV